MEAYLCGIGWITGTSMGYGKLGGECVFSDLPLPPLTRKEVFPEPNQRFGRMSEYAKLGMAAIAFALRDAGLEAWSEKRPIGVVASTSLGCLATDVDYHRTVLLEGGGLASPNLFAYTLANCFLGDAAIQFGLTGSCIAINEARQGLDALRFALEEIEIGAADTMVAGICDVAAPELVNAASTLKPGAIFLALSSAPPASGAQYGIITLSDDGELFHNGKAVGSLLDLVQSALALRR
jgi:3-oxoacyl-[acyl-carrier-protein] synthase II